MPSIDVAEQLRMKKFHEINADPKDRGTLECLSRAGV